MRLARNIANIILTKKAIRPNNLIRLEGEIINVSSWLLQLVYKAEESSEMVQRNQQNCFTFLSVLIKP